MPRDDAVYVGHMLDTLGKVHGGQPPVPQRVVEPALDFGRRQSADGVRAVTGWPLRVAVDGRETMPPTEAGLRLVRACDPLGFRTR